MRTLICATLEGTGTRDRQFFLPECVGAGVAELAVLDEEEGGGGAGGQQQHQRDQDLVGQGRARAQVVLGLLTGLCRSVGNEMSRSFF